MEERLELVGAAAESSYGGKLAMRALPLSSTPIPRAASGPPCQTSWWEASAMPPSKTARSLSPPIPIVGRRRRTFPYSLRHSHRQGDLLLRTGPSGVPDASRRPHQSQEGRQSPQRAPALRHGSPSALASFGSFCLCGLRRSKGLVAAKRRERKRSKGRPGSSHGTIFFFSRLRRKGVGGPENFGALGGGPAAELRLAPSAAARAVET